MRKSWLIGGGAILVIALLTALFVVKRRHPPVPVPVVATAPSIFQGTEITLTGALEPQSSEPVIAPVAGVLEAWFVDVGNEVYEDQLVGRIRNADLENELERAQAALDRAQIRAAGFDELVVSTRLEVSRTSADQTRVHNELDRLEKLFDRYKNLYEVGALPRLTYEKTLSDYNSAKAEAENRDRAAKDAQDKADALDRNSAEAKNALAAPQAALEKAKAAVANCDLHSPADGVVLTRTVHQGEKVDVSDENLMSIATDLTKLTVSLTPDPPVLARIRTGQHAFVHTDEGDAEGEVHEIRGAQVVVTFTAAKPVTKLETAAQVRIVF